MAGATGSGPTFGPCSAYASWNDVDACHCDATVDDEAEQQLWLDIATEVIYGLTGGKYSGQCVRSFTPCRPACVTSCSCTCGPAKARLDLGLIPVWGAFVTIDGEPIEVTIEDWRWLIREDGLRWPICTDGDWLIEYTYGWPVPAGITMATARLACEYAKQCAGQPCGLDPRTTSYTREGLTVQIADPQVMLDKGLTGIPFVDAILGNPMHRRGGQIVDLAAAPAGFSTSWP